MLRRWGSPVVFVLLGAVFVMTSVGTSPVAAAVEVAAMLALALLFSPIPFPRSTDIAEAHRRSGADGRPVVLWRPGCPYCLRLRQRLGRDARRLHWVDIWADPQAAAELRTHADGNETVPTVLAGGQAYVNPDPSLVRRLAATS